MLRLLQVCNVGRIVGGTAACAWTVTRALPDCEHVVVFLSSIAPETREVFAAFRLLQWDRVTAAQVAALAPDLVLLHNTPRGRVEGVLAAPTVQYLHSKIVPAAADLTLYCSHWLAGKYAADAARVLWQAVPKPLRTSIPARPLPKHDDSAVSRDAAPCDTRPLREAPVIGRLCTPQSKKWPADSAGFYADLAHRLPQVEWEFVGCPAALQPALREACRGRAAFLPATWQARSRLWHWDALLYHNPTVTESFGRTAAEAMRAGCIPIVDDRGGFREQLVPGTGFVCRDASDFAAAIKQILPPAVRLACSRACTAHADDRFSLARFRRDLLRRFGRLTGERGVSEAIRKRELAPGCCGSACQGSQDAGCLSPFPDSLSALVRPADRVARRSTPP